MRKSGSPVMGIRWFMVALVTAGLIVNYLARNTLSVAVPTMMQEMHFDTAEYSYIVATWQVCYSLMQPIAGVLLDTLGTKMGFLLFAFAWSLACAAASLATGWQSLAALRGFLGLAESAGIPAGVKATTEWFPAKERSIAIGWFNIGGLGFVAWKLEMGLRHGGGNRLDLGCALVHFLSASEKTEIARRRGAPLHPQRARGQVSR